VGVRVGGVRSRLEVSRVNPDGGWKDPSGRGTMTKPAVVVWGEWFKRGRLSLVTEVTYTERGQHNMRPIYDTFGEPEKLSKISMEFIDEEARYLSIPVLAKIMTPGLPALDPYFVAGPRVDVLVSRETDMMGYVKGFRRFLFGVDIGVGLQAPIDRSLLILDLRYCMTPTVGSHNAYYWDGDKRVTSHAWLFTFGSRFPI
jgi:hypothetical protein